MKSLLNDKSIRPVLALTVLALVLFLFRLDNIYFWDDEGWTLILGRITLGRGAPFISDADYRICNEFFTDNGLFFLQPWLQYYIAAATIFLFGQNAFGLRLPFALMGVACVPLLWRYARILKLPDRTANLAALLLATSVPFILLARNMRYYSMPPLFTLLLLISYHQLREEKSWALMKVAFFSALLLHTMPPVAGGILAAIGLHTLLLENRRVFIGKIAIAYLLAFLSLVPWLLLTWQSNAGFMSRIGANFTDPSFFMNVALATLLYLENLLHYGFPLLLFLPLLVILLSRKPRPAFLKSEAALLFLMIFFATGLIAYCLNYRLWSGYVSALIPLVTLGSAWVINEITGRKKILALPLALIVSSSTIFNTFHFSPETLSLPAKKAGENQIHRRYRVFLRNLFASPTEWLLPNYFRELSYDYEGPVEGILRYLKTHAHAQDTFFATNDSHTLHYMTGLRREDQIPFEKPPNWLIKRGSATWDQWKGDLCPGRNFNVDLYIRDFLTQHRYEIIVLDYPDLFHENIPVLPGHHWITPAAESHVILYHLKTNK